MSQGRVETVTAADEAAIFDVLTLAFSGDPMSRWTWPEARSYLDVFPRFAKAFGGPGVARGAAHRIGHLAAALWLPPGVAPDEASMGEILGTVRQEVMAEAAQVLEQMGSFHPREPHWYLPLIGVDPAHQGKGLGGALWQHALDTCDRDGVPAYLESSNPRNVPLYERHGFETLGTIQVGSSPTIIPMLRKPRRKG